MICLNCGCKIDLGVKFCPHCGAPTKLSDENSTGKIILIRDKKIMGFAIPFEVYIDDSKLGTLNNNTSLETKIPYGSHEIKLTSTEKDVIQNVNINENQKIAEIHIIPKMGLLAAKPYISKIDYKN